MKTMQNKKSIRNRIQKVVLILCAAALLVIALTGLLGMLRLRSHVISSNRALGNQAASDSGSMLLSQMQINLKDLSSSKAGLAEARLGTYAGNVSMFASYIGDLYRQKGSKSAVEVLPPDKANGGTLALQRNLRNESVSYADVKAETELLGNIRDAFDPVIRQDGNIATIYLGTKSGVMISYDTYSDSADTGGEEEYYDFGSRPWYREARNAGKLIFTDTYADGYGRGLTVTCAAPFYQTDGSFAGVVAMDILVSSMNRNIIDIGRQDGSYAFLINRVGQIIASPDMEDKADNLDNLPNVSDESLSTHSVAQQLVSGEAGFIQSTDGTYFAYNPISVADWTFVIHVPESVIKESSDTVRTAIEGMTDDTTHQMDLQIGLTITAFIVAFILILLACFLLARSLSRSLTAPLSGLEEDVRKISDGDLEHKAVVSTQDEIGDLANAFNSMTDSLRTHIQELTAVTAEKERIGAELDVAKHIQASMLPCIFPPFPERPEVDIYATMTPAKEVGGDFYDFFLVDDDHMAMVMADVSGKGVPAALFMVITKTLIKNSAQTGIGPKAVLEKVNDQLCANNDAEMFVTVWLGIMEISSGKMRCANAGHEFPSICRAGGSYELIKDKHGFVLAGMEGSRYREYELEMHPGDSLFLYTDGVAEATDAHNELYGTDRMLAALNRSKDKSCRDLLLDLKADIDAFVGEAPQFDDITMMNMRLQPEETVVRKLSVKPVAESTGQVMDFIEQEFDRAGLPAKMIAQMNIATDEIFSNIVNYSGATIATVGVSVTDERALLRFADNGIPYDPTSRPEPDTTLSAEKREIGGLGIFMVKKFMDSVTYEYTDGLNVLTLVRQMAAGVPKGDGK